MKIRTIEELQNILDDDFAWRRKELSQIYTSIAAAKSVQKNTNIRIGIVMLYAHWEGFVKKAADSYLTYIACKRLNYSQLANNIIAICLKSDLSLYQETNKNAIHIKMVEFLTDQLNTRAKVPTDDIINTQSNLSSAIFKEILSIVGVDYTPYELKEKFIDLQLLKIRNSVAHGQDPELKEIEFSALYSEITSLMGSLKIELLNNAVQAKFKRKLTDLRFTIRTSPLLVA